MVIYQTAIIFTVPIATPLEWNASIVFSVLFLFYGHPTLTPSVAPHPLLPALFAVPVVCLVTWGNLRPGQVSFLVAMRYYTGNWATTMWAMKPSAVTTIDANVVKYSGFTNAQLKRLCGEQMAELFAHEVHTFRALQLHGRGLFGLLPRAAGPQHESAYVLEGELVAGAVIGWNFGDGHLHGPQLVSALHERCHFEPGELCVVVLESAPLSSDRQPYQLVDAAAGVFETGYVLVSDMAARQPWEIHNVPVTVLSQRGETHDG